VLTIFRSSLIDHLGHESPANTQPVPIAYFYCVRNTAEPERANPDEILRSILKQLSSSEPDLRIREPVVKAYKEKKEEAKGHDPEKLMLDETVEAILALLETNPANIVIDALDECDPDRRHELFEALDTIIQQAASVVKVFVSSRDDGDIVCRLTSSPNVIIQTSDNKVDIECFARTEVAQAIKKKRLIKGNVSAQLEDRIIKTLIDGAHGM
jgi:exopolysaccharide biosynthesis predicted pyruvyltransferase EpsI